MKKFCEAATSTFFGRCTKLAQAKYGGRCYQHRKLTAADYEVAKKKRQAEYAATEHHAGLSASRARFIALALEHGLKAQVTIDAFTTFRHFALAKT